MAGKYSFGVTATEHLILSKCLLVLFQGYFPSKTHKPTVKNPAVWSIMLWYIFLERTVSVMSPSLFCSYTVSVA